MTPYNKKPSIVSLQNHTLVLRIIISLVPAGTEMSCFVWSSRGFVCLGLFDIRLPGITPVLSGDLLQP